MIMTSRQSYGLINRNRIAYVYIVECKANVNIILFYLYLHTKRITESHVILIYVRGECQKWYRYVTNMTLRQSYGLINPNRIAMYCVVY